MDLLGLGVNGIDALHAESIVAELAPDEADEQTVDVPADRRAGGDDAGTPGGVPAQRRGAAASGRGRAERGPSGSCGDLLRFGVNGGFDALHAERVLTELAEQKTG
ncbi:MAG: hypothetical protein ACT452_05440, partial [Microthrixaceae bacterium]